MHGVKVFKSLIWMDNRLMFYIDCFDHQVVLVKFVQSYIKFLQLFNMLEDDNSCRGLSSTIKPP